MAERDGRAPAMLKDQREALWNYLNVLLAEVAPGAEPTEPPVGATPPPPAPGATSRPSRAERPRTSGEGAAPTRDAPDTGVASPLPEPGAAPPPWARPDFQALLFHVGRLKLAVPLVKLHSVVPWTERINAMPNQPHWCHGMFRYRGRNVMVIDTERLVLPEDRRPTGDDGLGAAHILIVGDGRWGLACRTVGEVARLTPEEVKWRNGRGRRPWLAGTVLGRLCALMDTEAFSAMLNESRGAAS